MVDQENIKRKEKERDATRNLMRNEVQVCQTHIMLRSKEKETTGNFISFVF
jgi:hypothetical protein